MSPSAPARPPDLVIDDLLAGLGFEAAAARAAARGVLEAAGLTNPRKQRIAAEKRPAVAAALRAAFVVACARAACRDQARGTGRTLIEAARPAACEVCHGSTNRTEIDRAVAALRIRGIERLVVVGGSPATHEELRALIDDRVALRLVSGTERRNRSEARADLAWAGLVVVWGSTELDHKVSKLYTDARAPHVVTCPRRGIAALASTVLAHVARRA
jgi:hypothetical protein